MSSYFTRKGIFRRRYCPTATDSEMLCPTCHQPSVRLWYVTSHHPAASDRRLPLGWRYGCYKCCIIFVPPWDLPALDAPPPLQSPSRVA
ncbi:MAG: hypothetical protein WCK27_31145 [Verrucomicrobiota bacterium]|nr:hypothetical protein [Verrucomicrobiota bacterium]